MSANSGNSGVRNLRAMFENKTSDQSTSPPSRGRSPNPSELSNNSRPVSKVRASFVAVEKPGENGGPTILGLRRTSEVSSMGGIQESAVVDNEITERPLATNDTVSKDIASSVLAKTPPPNSANEEGGLGNILKGSAFVENTPSKPPSEVTNLGHAIASGQLQQPKTPGTSPSKSKDGSNAAAMVAKMQATDGSKSGPPPATTLKTTETARPIKPPPTRQEINTKSVPKSPIVTKPSPRTPTSPKVNIKGGPAKIRGVMESAKEAQKAREAARENSDKQGNPAPSMPKVDMQPKPKPAPGASKKEQTPTSPKTVRSPSVVKPKPPTIPGKLPAAATATTASIAAKHDAQHSPTEPDRKAVTKKTSTLVTRPPRASTSSVTSSLAKKASRASLANGHDRPKSRASTSKPDEGFLARMMRPTASSAQKVHDKVQPNSPPRARNTSHPTKAKQAAKQEAPPKMHVDAPTEAEGENKENNGDHQDQDQNGLPDITHPSLDVVKPDPMNVDAEQEPVASEITSSAVKVNGEAQEVH